MSAIIIDGVAMAKQVLAEQKTRADGLAQQGRPPGLAVVLVGDDQASAVYVRSKERACREAGVRTFDTRLPAATTEAELLQKVEALNRDPQVHGILVQLPLPAHINAVTVLQRIALAKDVTIRAGPFRRRRTPRPGGLPASGSRREGNRQ